MFRYVDQALLIEYYILGEHAVYASPQGRLALFDIGLAVNPFLHESWSDAVPGFHSRDALSYSNNFAGPIRKGNTRQLHSRIVCPGHDHQVAVVERKGLHLDEGLPGPRYWLRFVDKRQSLYSKSVANLECFHFLSPPPISVSHRLPLQAK